MVGKYRRLLQQETGKDELGEEEETVREESHIGTRMHSALGQNKFDADNASGDNRKKEEVIIDRLEKQKERTQIIGGANIYDGISIDSASNNDNNNNNDDDSHTSLLHRFGKRASDKTRAKLTTENDSTAVDGVEECDSRADTGEEAEDEEEETLVSDDELAVSSCSQRLYSCDACPHAVFTTHAALLAHAEESHAELVPGYARLRRVAEKLSPVWSRALKARREAIAMWGRKVFAIAAQRDAGEAKMREAHRARAQLEIVVRRWNEKARVFIFGSSVAMGVWDGMADVDFAVVDVAALNAGNWPPLEKNAVRSITELLRRVGFSFVNLEPISHARVPIIKHHASSPIFKTAPMDAEDVVARSVRFVLNAPASREDRVMLEGSVREAVGTAGVQQVWWNRTGDVMSMTLDSTTTAIRAAMCSPAFVTPALRARVQPVHDECRPELYNIDFDLSFRAFGIRNSKLLRQYLMSHPCARPGSIVLKDWSKTSGVNNSVNGYFTSYAINIMWIYYLIQKKYVPYVDPLDIPASLVDDRDLDPKYKPMVDPALTQAELEAVYQDAGNMLVGFFYFYSFEFDWEHHVISLNRPGITTKMMLGWHVEDVVPQMSLNVGSGPNNRVGISGNNNSSGSTTRRHPTRYELCIEDPYEENLNLGRHIGITKSLRVRTELYRGLLSLLKDGEKESCVFASTDMAESKKVVDSTFSGLPARALFKLMALVTQAIAESKGGLSSNNEISAKPAREDATLNASTVATAESASLPFETLPLTSSSVTGINGVSEKHLEKIFLEKAALEYQLARKVWNWHQLIHRLGYKVHRGYVMPRRELGVRCIAKRDSDESLPDANGSKNVAPRGLNLTENMLRDLSSGFMTLTPEWVAWSAPWASKHMRGYSRFTAVTDDSLSSSSSSAATATQTTAAPIGTETSAGPMRQTRRNAAPARIATTRMHVLKMFMMARGKSTDLLPTGAQTKASAALLRLTTGVKRTLPLKFLL